MAIVSDNLTLSNIAALSEMEAQIDALQKAKREFIAGLRDEHGKLYANSLKSALRLSRMDSAKRAEQDEVDAEAFRILALIESSPAPRATRAREIITEFDAETGEIIGEETDEEFAAGVEIMRQRAAADVPVGNLELVSGIDVHPHIRVRLSGEHGGQTNSNGVGNSDAVMWGGAEVARQAHNLEVAGSIPAPATSTQARGDSAPASEPVKPAVDAAGEPDGGENVDALSILIETAIPALGSEGYRADGEALGSDVELVAPIQPATATESTGSADGRADAVSRRVGDEPNHLVPNDLHKAALDEAHLQAGIEPGPVDLTPDDSGDTAEPDSGLGACPDAEVAAEPERLQLSPPDPLRSEAATRKDAGTTAPAPDSSPPSAPAPRTLAEIAADMGYAAEPHPDCRKPRICREFSHAGLCLDCRIAAGLETARAA